MVSIEDFSKELQEDTRIDEINLLQKQLMLPAIKHKWVARLIDHKRKLNQLNKKKRETRDGVLDALSTQGIPPIPKSSIEKKISSSEAMTKLEEEIKDVEITIEYLEKVEQIFKSMTYDISNITKIMLAEIS